MWSPLSTQNQASSPLYTTCFAATLHCRRTRHARCTHSAHVVNCDPTVGKTHSAGFQIVANGRRWPTTFARNPTQGTGRKQANKQQKLDNASKCTKRVLYTLSTDCQEQKKRKKRSSAQKVNKTIKRLQHHMLRTGISCQPRAEWGLCRIQQRHRRPSPRQQEEKNKFRKIARHRFFVVQASRSCT